MSYSTRDATMAVGSLGGGAMWGSRQGNLASSQSGSDRQRSLSLPFTSVCSFPSIRSLCRVWLRLLHFKLGVDVTMSLASSWLSLNQTGLISFLKPNF